MSDRVTLTLTNRLADLEQAQDAANRLIADHQVDDLAAYALRLAIEELGSNVIRHAFGDGRHHEFQMTIRVAPTELELTIEDDGRAFDPSGGRELSAPSSLEDAPTGGMGLSLVSGFASHMTYARIHGRNRSIVHIRRATS